ncbi:MAG: hypothetical protein KVP17_003336 [Porospora cf. gigantea B]|uniref:uncharacterized protein n=2 Tax=Porospora cf. gigantea B TaxID=2853592 RepID=UPI0035719C22|nr:MAG: hypothetical protein KVP17_003336 [Porospora cf. gigantea B]
MTVHDDLAVCYCMTSLQGLYHDNEDRCSVAKFDGWSVNTADSALQLPMYQPVEAKANLDVEAPTPRCDDQVQRLIQGSAKTWCAPAKVSLSKGNCVEEISLVGGLMFTICDGHDGPEAADLVVQELPRTLMRCWRETNSQHVIRTQDQILAASARASIKETFVQSLFEVEESFKRKYPVDTNEATGETTYACTSGSCALCTIILGNEIWCANLGDCRAGILFCDRQGAKTGYRFTWLSREHRIRNQDEIDRVNSCGGWFSKGRLGGMLEPTRTIGDLDVKASQPSDCLSVVPEVRMTKIERSGLLMIATDGVWDEMNGQEVFRFLRKHKDVWSVVKNCLNQNEVVTTEQLEELSRRIVTKARYRGSEDDITLICALLKPASSL